MKTLAFFDTKEYDKTYFDILKETHDIRIRYFEDKLSAETVSLAEGADAVCVFVNDDINEAVIERLYQMGVRIIALRCAGYNNVDFKAAYGKIHVVRVPAYSPYAVAEYTMALLLAVNRKVHKSYIRTRDFNFSLNRLVGFDLHGKTVGIIGTGKIGQIFANICKGFGMNILAYDVYPNESLGLNYVSLDELCEKADIVSLHCPLTESTKHLINTDTLSKMKDGVFLVNTSRGALIDTEALLDAIRTRKVGGAALDVYEEETDIFFEDFSDSFIGDDTLSLLLSMPNVIVSSHQAFLTKEALENIADVTVENLNAFFAGETLKNEICYHCQKSGGHCKRKETGRCF